MVLPALDVPRAVRVLHRGARVHVRAVRSGCRRRRSSARCACGSSASMSVTTAWRSARRCTLRDPGLIHLMVEVDSLDAVGQALDRVNKDGFQLSSTLGRHTNDKMVSFYVRAPRRLGHRVRHRRHACRRKPLHRRGNHRRQLLGPRMGSRPARSDAAMTPDAASHPVSASSIVDWDYEADVVIAGYGVAGAAAAVEAGRGGRRRPRPRAHRILGWRRSRWPVASSTSAAERPSKRPADSPIPPTTWRPS